MANRKEEQPCKAHGSSEVLGIRENEERTEETVKTIAKMLWRGKVTALAVVVALTLVVASPALAKTIKKMVVNTGALTTALEQWANTGGGSAIDLKVNSGVAPLTVNSDAKVDNLNADKLDDKDSTEFLGASDKAADADKLDGKDSTDFLTHDNQLWAVVKGSDASLIRGSGVAATFKFSAQTGSYEIAFNRDISSCAYTATPFDPTAGRGNQAPNGEIGVRALATSANGVAVTTFDSSGTRADRNFSLVVNC